MGMQDPPTGTFTCLDMRRPRRYIILITSEAVLLAIAAELAVKIPAHNNTTNVELNGLIVSVQ